MTTFTQFCRRAKMRHDFSDQIQVRYPHPNGENFDTWVSGQEVLQRLKTESRRQLIERFSRLNLQQAREAAKKEIDRGKTRLRQDVAERLADTVADNLGDNVFSHTLAHKIRGSDSQQDPHQSEKNRWQAHLQDDAFRLIVLELAWINLEGTFPPEPDEEPDDWI